ncbi:hypothetical protein IV203_037043 [Nitzschia inconspicua]|uniref:Uncharacterized protein n=1 Tax=Nitzschia inconspicua TaxID=303405 RepID=A0A9K3LKS3_9STRA|nr:hypothetical protein IV203_037043 [Nitzschia inconspicua]
MIRRMLAIAVTAIFTWMMMPLSSTSAFVVTTTVTTSSRTSLPFSLVTTSSSTTATTKLRMGLFDFFSPEAKEARERQKRAKIEEQERLQKAILERRKNPQLMEEYEQKVQLRRELKMQGNFDEAQKVELYEGYQNQTLLDGTTGIAKDSSEL